MVRACACALVLTLVVTPAALAANAAAAPDENHLFEFEKRNRHHPWLRVTTDSGRFGLRADRLDIHGLGGLRARHDQRLPRDPLAWPEIHRLDEIVTRSRPYGWTGGVLVGLLAAGLGNALGAPSGSGGNYAFVGLLAGGATGGWLGSRYGDRFEHDVNWYTAPPPAPPPTDAVSAPVALADSARADRSGTVAVVPVAADSLAEPPASAEALKLAARLQPTDHIRVAGEFGRFQGYARVAGPHGLERILVDRHAPKAWFPDSVPVPIPWSQIDQVAMRGGHARQGALIGGLLVGAFGGVAGLAVAAFDESPSDAATAGFVLYGAAVGGAIGVVLGAGVGALSRGWKLVYERR
jgi:hypothetical protein